MALICMHISCSDGHDDSDRRLFCEGAYSDGDPHPPDQIRPVYGAYPAALGAGPCGSDRRIPGPGRVDLERHDRPSTGSPRSFCTRTTTVASCPWKIVCGASSVTR